MNQGPPRWQEPQDAWSAPPEPAAGNIWEDPEPATRWDAGDEPAWRARPAVPQPGPARFGSPQPGFTQARPMPLGELLRASVRVVLRNPGVSFGSSLIIGAPASAANTLALVVLGSEGQSRPASAVILIATLLILSAVSALLCGILVTPVRLWHSGRRAGFHESWRPGLYHLGPLAGYVLLVTGAVGAVVAALIGTVVAAAAVDPLWDLALLITLPLTLAGAAWIYVVTLFGAPAIIVENAGAVSCLRRSRELLRGTFWPTLGTMALVLTASLLAQAVIELPFSLIAEALRESTGTEAAPTLTRVLGLTAQLTVTFPFLSAVIVLLYFDRASRQAAPPR